MRRRPSAQPSPATRRATVYLATLGCALLVTLAGVSAVLATRVRHRMVAADTDHAATRYLAQSGVDLAQYIMALNPNWRTEYGSGVWFEDEPIGAGLLTLVVSDPGDGDVSVGICDAVLVRSTAQQGAARFSLEVMLVADAVGRDPLADVLARMAPLAWWRLGETDGTQSVDAAGNFVGLYRNGVQVGAHVPQRCDRAAYFDGVDDLVDIPHAPEFLLDSGSVHFWFITDVATGPRGLWTKDAQLYGSGGHFGIWIDNSRVRTRIQSLTASYEIVSGVVPTNTWHQVVVTFGDTGLRLYVNGVQVASNAYKGGWGTTSGGSGNTEPIGIGVNTSNSHAGVTSGWVNPFRGMIDEVALFDRILTAAEVAALYQAGSTHPPHTLRTVPGTWTHVVP
ncbi:MAG: LamG domain-containing protein [Phycisphaerales bacterium]|nr:LamG domain-containing protein [Phycisphaerales bacterium]